MLRLRLFGECRSYAGCGILNKSKNSYPFILNLKEFKSIFWDMVAMCNDFYVTQNNNYKITINWKLKVIDRIK